LYNVPTKKPSLSVVGNAATTALVAVEIAPCPAPATNAAIAALVPAVAQPIFEFVLCMPF
jgi:hypothetical protein